LPEVADLVNVSESNLLQGWLVRIMGLSSRGYSGEVTEGFSIVLLILFAALFIVTLKRRSLRTDEKVFADIIPNVTFVTVIICLALIIRLSSNGVSLWWFVYTLLPVTRSMRAVARFMLWLSFPMAVITAYSANRYIGSDISVRTKIISGFAVVLIFVSNINTAGVPRGWNAPDEYAFISSVTPPPEDAESFYIIDSAETEDPWYIYQLDAFEIATWYSIKTINGYSGQMPSDWEGNRDVCSEGYESSVFTWIKNHDLQNVYAYDRATNQWISYQDWTASCVNDVFCPLENKFSLTTGLQDWTQGNFAWTGQEFETRIDNAQIKNTGLVIKMQMRLSNYMAQNPELSPYIRIYVDNELVQEVDATDEYVEINIPMTEHIGDVYDIQVKTNCYFNPKDLGQSSDDRNLSIAMYYVGN
jgi:hypothetical protein